MLKLNLRSGPAPISLGRYRPWATGFFLVLLIGQMISFLSKQAIVTAKQVEAQDLQVQLNLLNAQKEALTISESPEVLNGAVADRMRWFEARKKSPVMILAKLEKNRSGPVELKSFEGSESRGILRLLAGDMEVIQRYIHAVFAGTEVRIAIEDRLPNGIIAVCTWTE